MGNIQADDNFIRLIDQYEKLVYSICYKITNHYFDAQDLTQETFLAVYKHLPSFDGQNEKAWISRIATNKCLDYLKQAQRRSLPTEGEFFQEMKSRGPTTEETILENDVKQQLYQTCRQLKPPYDEIAIDYFYNEMSVPEIAEAAGKNPKTIQTQIYRAKAMLKKLWGKELLYER